MLTTRPFADYTNEHLLHVIELTEASIKSHGALVELLGNLNRELLARQEDVEGAHVANLVPHYAEEDADHWVSQDGFRKGAGEWIEYRITRHGRRTTGRYSLLYVGPKGSSRRVFQGPILSGPYLALVGQATIIADHHIPQPDRIVVLNHGDAIVCNGQTMVLVNDHYHHEPHMVTLEEFEQAEAEKQVRAPESGVWRELAIARKLAVAVARHYATSPEEFFAADHTHESQANGSASVSWEGAEYNWPLEIQQIPGIVDMAYRLGYGLEALNGTSLGIYRRS